jgi:hypothetical protein
MDQAQNTNEEQSSSDAKNNSDGNSSQRPIPLPRPQTSNVEPQTETMEVHKHPHHVMHKKKWDEYLLEFIMLFLAVFLGFIAENVREHQVEKQRAKEFAHLLVGDLATDTLELTTASHVLQTIIVSGDSLGTLLSNYSKNVPGGKLYYYEYWSGWQWNVISQDATLQQLKASGALRYFKTDVVRRLMDYEQSINVIYLLQNKYVPEKIANWNLVQKVFDQRYFNLLDGIRQGARDSSTRAIAVTDPNLIRFLNTDYQLISYDKASLQEIGNWAFNSSRNYRTTRRDVEHAKQKARELIGILNKEYSFDDK